MHKRNITRKFQSLDETANAENPEHAKVYEQYGGVVGTRSIGRLTLAEKDELLGNDNGIL